MVNNYKKGIKNKAKINEPIDPDMVFLGLIFVNFLPLKVLPKANPPISVNIDTKTVKSKYTLNSVLKDSIYNIKNTNDDKYNNETNLYKNLKILSFNEFFNMILDMRA